MSTIQEIHPLQTIFEALQLPIRSYSGRGMDRREWLAVEADSPISLLTSVLDNFHDLTSEDNAVVSEGEDDDGNPDKRGVVLKTIQIVSDAFKSARSDSMGRGYIVYFPYIRFVGQTHQTDQGDVLP